MTQAASKKPLPAASKMRLDRLREGRAAQIMHIGPFSAERSTIDRLHDFIADQGSERTGKNHEIYLGDPRRTDPDGKGVALARAAAVWTGDTGNCPVRVPGVFLKRALPVRGNVCHVAVQQVPKVTMSRRQFARDGRSDVFGLEPTVRPSPMCAPAIFGANAFCTPGSHVTTSIAVRHI